jgi:hypothetical protein
MPAHSIILITAHERLSVQNNNKNNKTASTKLPDIVPATATPKTNSTNPFPTTAE